jgi:hypothetical protein
MNSIPVNQYIHYMRLLLSNAINYPCLFKLNLTKPEECLTTFY